MADFCPSDLRMDGERSANERAPADHLLTNRDDLYFVRIRNGPVKIGRSRKVSARMASFRCSMPYEIDLVGLLPGRGCDEKRWHGAFRSRRIRGEWFHWSDKLALAITDALRGHWPDVRLMPPDEVQRRYDALLGITRPGPCLDGGE